ncbi:hypothetical protein AVT69_gp189 [Pseudomonas phage PhiPA3]|uniref:Uncharacterized protein 191 n=1 Tax=Pseudomonas phage PhiPA3 TaxID=998086 RepID=F8SK60_BPPA3|nr:hypothetical protein AVT69_gp189 [Pseudomonas phage PhiPA3]AEH03614.1 hypothetical protein [Pseudomonas phage PhiPA3]
MDASLMKLVLFMVLLITFVLAVVFWVYWKMVAFEKLEEQKKIIACKRWRAVSSSGVTTAGIFCYCGHCDG